MPVFNVLDAVAELSSIKNISHINLKSRTSTDQSTWVEVKTTKGTTFDVFAYSVGEHFANDMSVASPLVVITNSYLDTGCHTHDDQDREVLLRIKSVITAMGFTTTGLVG